jgi:hypothetical protein
MIRWHHLVALGRIDHKRPRSPQTYVCLRSKSNHPAIHTTIHHARARYYTFDNIVRSATTTKYKFYDSSSKDKQIPSKGATRVTPNRSTCRLRTTEPHLTKLTGEFFF